MLLKQATLEGIVRGTIRAVYRRWRQPRVKLGSTFKTSAGVIAVRSIERTSLAALDERAARQAGYASRAALIAELERYGDGTLYRIALRRVGPDPRTALRARSRLSAAERALLERKLASLGARSADGAWGPSVLERIAARPAVRAPELARELGMQTARFKARVRQLKELGLTESLGVGYRLSPRGRALLRGLR